MTKKKDYGFYEPGNKAFDDYIESYVQEKHITIKELEQDIKETENKHIQQLKEIVVEKEMIKVMRLVLKKKKEIAQLQTLNKN